MSNNNKNPKSPIYLCQNQESDMAITLKEDCMSNWNLGWICWSHGNLDLKINGAYQANRYLIGEIAASGGDFRAEPGYTTAFAPQTHCMTGVEYEGSVPFSSGENAVRYFKKYFEVIACPMNQGQGGHPTCDQAWIDAI